MNSNNAYKCLNSLVFLGFIVICLSYLFLIFPNRAMLRLGLTCGLALILLWIIGCLIVFITKSAAPAMKYKLPEYKKPCNYLIMIGTILVIIGWFLRKQHSDGYKYWLVSGDIIVIVALLGLWLMILTSEPIEATMETLVSGALQKYTGTFISASIPQKLSIQEQDNLMYGQLTGQAKFPLGAAGENRFVYDMLGIVIEFYTDSTELILKQHGKIIFFTRVKG